MRPDTLQRHVEELAADLGIDVDQAPNMPGMMYVEEDPPRIEVPTLEPSVAAPSVELAYLVALHEIGHCVLGHTQGRPPFEDKRYYFDHGVLRCEAEAWNYALDVALLVLDPVDAHYAAENYLGSYRRAALRAGGRPTRLGNGNRHHVEFVFDNPHNEYVQEAMRRLRDSHGLLKEAAP